MEDCNCKCDCTSSEVAATDSTGKKYLLYTIAIALIWIAIYPQLSGFASFLTFTVIGLQPETRLGEAVHFFLYDTPKIFMLLTGIIFLVGVLRSFITPERTRALLAGKRESAGNVMAAFLGVATPFCSCSAVPLFVGFLSAGIPLGVTFSFLIASPMINEVALVMLYGLFGWKVALLYLVTGLAVAIVAGFIIGRLKMEHHLEEWVQNVRKRDTVATTRRLTVQDRIISGVESTKEILGRVWIYIIAGIAIGAGIHGYVPENFMASFMGKDAWWAVPAAVLVGIPMYTNASGVIPIVHALMLKGAALGTVLAFMKSVIALSLPEMMLLRQAMKVRLVAVFVGVVGVGILIVGYLFNLIL